MTWALLALACAGGPRIRAAEVVVTWSEPDDDFAWHVWAEVDHPAGIDAVEAVEALFMEEDGPGRVRLDLGRQGSTWEAEGLQDALGLDCCTDYVVRLEATDAEGRVDRHEVRPRLELP